MNGDAAKLATADVAAAAPAAVVIPDDSACMQAGPASGGAGEGSRGTTPGGSNTPSLKTVAGGVLSKIKVQSSFSTLRQQDVPELAWDDFVHVRELGRGSFGVVGLYNWRPGATHVVDGLECARSGQVAVKSLLPAASLSPVAVDDFKREVAILGKLTHSCLTACLGTGTRPVPGSDPVLFLAMEAETGGDLRHMVLNAMGEPRVYTDADVVRWLHDVARGLHYLHTRTPLVIHRDLKLENVLLTASWQAKITDFGLTKVVFKKALPSGQDETYKLTGGSGSLKYMAPENFLGKSQKETIDQYSYSILAWELQSRMLLLFMRTKKLAHGARTDYTPQMWALDAATQGVRPEVRESWPADLKKVMVGCWAATPSERPAFSQVMALLEPMLRPDQFTDPTKAKAGGGGDGGCCSLQ